jgi:hypothetical protein
MFATIVREIKSYVGFPAKNLRIRRKFKEKKKEAPEKPKIEISKSTYLAEISRIWSDHEHFRSFSDVSFETLDNR